MNRLIGQKEQPLNLEIFSTQYRIQLRKRGIHPSLADRENYDEYLISGKRRDMNLERLKADAKRVAESETRRIQGYCRSLVPDIGKYSREFVDRVKAL